MRWSSLKSRAGTGSRSYVLLAPADAKNQTSFRNVSVHHGYHRQMMTEMQRLRGRLYVEDGAITVADLDEQGRHISPEDEKSWHLLTLDEESRVAGCMRYIKHDNSVRFESLKVSEAALARCPEWNVPLRRAVEKDLMIARQAGLAFVE